MQIDVEALLAPVPGDAPAGVDLGDDNDRLAVDDVFESVQRPDFDGDEPNWRQVTQEVVDLLGRSKDLWLAVYLCRAGAKLGDLEQIAGGAKVLAGLLREWDHVFPTLDDVGAQGRKSRCAELGQRRAFLSALEATPLVSDPRHGSFAVADLERLSGEGEGGDVGFSRIMQADGKEKLADALVHVEAISAAIRECDAIFKDRTQSTADRPDYAPLHETLRRMTRAIAPFLGDAAAAAAGADDAAPAAEDAPAASSPVTGTGAPGAIRSREDVIKAIDAICGYYARQEPASPVPLALKRARAWVNLDFLTVLRDIAPDSLSDARRVLMQSESRDDD